MRPPSRSIAASLVLGAWSGTTTVQGMPSLRAFHATPWAILPALAVHTPRASAAGSASASALPAPRILKDPMGCRHSSFKKIFDGPSSSSRTRGVRRAVPASRAAAARISAMPIGSIGVVALASELDRLALVPLSRPSVDLLRGGQVFDRQADRLEDGDVRRGGAARDRARDELRELAEDVVVADGALPARHQEVAGLL